MRSNSLIPLIYNPLKSGHEQILVNKCRVQIEDMRENQFVAELAKQAGGTGHVWLGAIRYPSGSPSYIWSDESPFGKFEPWKGSSIFLFIFEFCFTFILCHRCPTPGEQIGMRQIGRQNGPLGAKVS